MTDDRDDLRLLLEARVRDPASPELAVAIGRVQLRKYAAGVPEGSDLEGDEEGADLRDHRGSLAGTDLDLEELARAMHVLAATAAPRITDVAGLAGLMVDGVLVGLELAKVRAERANANAADRWADADRIPYVGTGADGARRSAQVDREEADTLPTDSERRVERLESARRWDAQARRHEEANRG